jgi:hypothetical protein
LEEKAGVRLAYDRKILQITKWSNLSSLQNHQGSNHSMGAWYQNFALADEKIWRKTIGMAKEKGKSRYPSIRRFIRR